MHKNESIVERIQGPLTPVISAFDEDENLDTASVCRWVDWLINSGIRLFWTTYGTSHYGFLTDDEVMRLNMAVAEVTKGRAIFIASTTFHWPIHKCILFLNAAADAGVDIVKLQVDWRWAPDEDVVFKFYSKIADQSPLPLFAYTVANARTKGMSLDLLNRILDIPQFVGMKNDSGDFYEQCEYLRAIRRHGRPFAAMTGGSMMSFLHGRQFGARAFATSLAFFAPHVPIRFTQSLDEGRPEEAVKIIKEYEEPYYSLEKKLQRVHYSFDHTALKFLGLFNSDQMRYPCRRCDNVAEQAIRKFLEEHGLLEIALNTGRAGSTRAD